MNEFKREIEKYKLIVTYNGLCFDVPFIETKFPEISFDQLHIDLRYVLKRLGFSGGLKNIEKQVGIKRGNEVQDFDGRHAIRLWKRYKRGDDKSLDLLIKYNIEDIENLKVLMDLAYDKLKSKCFDKFCIN